MGWVEEQPGQVGLSSQISGQISLLSDDTPELNGKNTHNCLGPVLHSYILATPLSICGPPVCCLGT